MQNTFLVLLPPVLVILCAYITQRIITSLLMGIVSALLIAYDFSFTKAVPAFFAKLLDTTELSAMTSWHNALATSALFIGGFLLILSMLTMLLHESGGVFAYGNYIKKHLKKPWQAEASGMVLSCLLFVDDYFSSITVGSVMRSVTDLFRIPRVKLALLTNSMAASLAILAPVSSWVAEIVMNMRRSGIETHGEAVIIQADPFSLYVSIIPFFFYSLLLIIVLGYMVYSRYSYGIVHQHETIASKTGNLFGGQPVLDGDTESGNVRRASLIDFIVPMAGLFMAVFTCMLYFGDYVGFGGSKSLVFALQQAPKSASLFIGSCFTLMFSTIFLLARKKITLARLPYVYAQGILLMYSSVIFLLLVWTLSSLLRTELATGQYVASFLGNNIPIALLPVIFFMIAVCISTLMGSAWGAMGILIPIALEMVVSLLTLNPPVMVDQVLILYPLLGALISGAVVSNHISPIADTLLMSTKSAGAYHHDVVKAQSQLSMPVIVATAGAYVCAGLLITRVSFPVTIACSLAVGLVMSMMIFKVCARR